MLELKSASCSVFISVIFFQPSHRLLEQLLEFHLSYLRCFYICVCSLFNGYCTLQVCNLAVLARKKAKQDTTVLQCVESLISSFAHLLSDRADFRQSCNSKWTWPLVQKLTNKLSFEANSIPPNTWTWVSMECWTFFIAEFLFFRKRLHRLHVAGFLPIPD